MLQKIKPKKFKLGIVGGGPGSWIGHVHRISSRYDDKYEIVAGVFSRSVDKSRKFGQSIGLDKSRCYSNYKEMSEKEAKRKDGINVVAIMTPPSSHQIIAENFIKKNIHVISDKPFAGNLEQGKKLYKAIKNNKKILVFQFKEILKFYQLLLAKKKRQFIYKNISKKMDF